MEKMLFSKYGIDIIRKGNRFYIRYDSGELAGKERQSEISEEEVTKAMKSPQDAYEVIIETQNREQKYKPLF